MKKQMNENWVSVAQSAEYLDINPRTVERWIRSGSLQSRLRPDGQREVLLDDYVNPAVADALEEDFSEPVTPVISAPAPVKTLNTPAVNVPEAAPTVAVTESTRTEDSAMRVAEEAFLEAKELAEAFRVELQFAREAHESELSRTRKSSRIAWWILAAAGVVICIGGAILATQTGALNVEKTKLAHLGERLDDSNDKIIVAQNQSERLEEKIESLQGERLRLTEELARVKIDQVDTAGQLTAYQNYAEELTTQLQTIRTQQARAEEARKMLSANTLPNNATSEEWKKQQQAAQDKHQADLVAYQRAQEVERVRAAQMEQLRAARTRMNGNPGFNSTGPISYSPQTNRDILAPGLLSNHTTPGVRRLNTDRTISLRAAQAESERSNQARRLRGDLRLSEIPHTMVPVGP